MEHVKILAIHLLILSLIFENEIQKLEYFLEKIGLDASKQIVCCEGFTGAGSSPSSSSQVEFTVQVNEMTKRKEQWYIRTLPLMISQQSLSLLCWETSNRVYIFGIGFTEEVGMTIVYAEGEGDGDGHTSSLGFDFPTTHYIHTCYFYKLQLISRIITTNCN